MTRPDDDLRALFHRLNNQLSIIMANAELLHARAPDETTRARASQVMEAAVQAMGVARELRGHVEAPVPQPPVGAPQGPGTPT